MKGAILVSAAVSTLVSIIGAIVALNVLVPAVVEAQETRIRAESVVVVDESGTNRATMRTGPGARSSMTVQSQDGRPRVSMYAGGSVAGGGTQPDEARVGVFAPEGSPSVAILGTGAGGVGSALNLYDGQGQIRIWLRVDGDGNPSIEMRDASGNVIWRAQ